MERRGTNGMRVEETPQKERGMTQTLGIQDASDFQRARGSLVARHTIVCKTRVKCLAQCSEKCGTSTARHAEAATNQELEGRMRRTREDTANRLLIKMRRVCTP